MDSIIENERGELLLCRRALEPAKGTLDLVGSFVDPGESSEQAICREIEEEIGVRIDEKELTYLYSLPNTYNYSNFIVHTTDAVFHAVLKSSAAIEAHDDVAECLWVKPSDVRLEDIGLNSVREAMRRFLHVDGV